MRDGDSGAKYKGRQNETRMEMRREGGGHCWRKEKSMYETNFN